MNTLKLKSITFYLIILLISFGLSSNAQSTTNFDILKLAGTKVVIGDVSSPSNDYKLFVEKGILTEKVRVAVKDSADWADYVFANDYELMPIEQLEDYITENNHLPNVPSAEEVVNNGVDMAKMDATLLEKIEELTLYVIQQQKEIEALKTQINNKQ